MTITQDDEQYNNQPSRDPSALPPIAKVIVWLTAIATVVFSGWCTVVAFTGGTLPILGWHLDGGIPTGLLWLFIVDPIVIVVCQWLSGFLLTPIILALVFRKHTAPKHVTIQK